MKRLLFFLFILQLCVLSKGSAQNKETWKAGIATVVITPQEPIWMAGFADRVRPSEGVLHNLWVKALVIEDAAGKQAVLITAELSGIPKSVSDTIRNRIQRQYNLTRSQIIINTSHTHSGPVLNNALLALYPLEAEHIRTIKSYTIKLENQIVAVVGKALRSMKPVNLSSGNGITRFQVNRRNNIEARLEPFTSLKGPNDYSVPVLRVESTKGKLMAVAFGYACHNTVLNDYKISGDYSGFAQIQLEKSHPGVTAMFFQGCGGNQNALPRKTVALARQYGEELASAVDAVLVEKMKALEPSLITAYSEVEIEFGNPPTKEELTKLIAGRPGFQQRWAAGLSSKMERNEPLRKNYPYPVQLWKLGDQTIIALGGEPVVDYAIKFKQMLGKDTFVMGYSNDVMAYIPTVEIIREGGYEGASSQMAFGHPGPWKETIESIITEEVAKLAKQAGVNVSK